MLEKELLKYFGFSTFKTGQREVISRLVNNQSAAAIFPTGAGKSLCYQLPAMILPHMTLVVSPLLALMKDQIDFLTEHNIPAARLDSTLSKEEHDTILERARNGQLKILMIAVERFNNERFRAQLQRLNISMLVVDEAHCISEWGHNFRPDYLKLPVYRKEFGIPQVLLLTATATEQVRDDMCGKFLVPSENVVVTGFYRNNLFLKVSPTSETEKLNHLRQRIKESPNDPTIVYVTLQKTTEQVSNFLSDNGISAFPYHAGMDDEERERIQNEFLAGKINCIVATIAFGMGIDKKNIRRVIHYDLPKSIENYSQEIGRSGRDGKQSFCEVLANRNNISQLENFIYGDTPEREAIEKLLHKIKYHDDPVWEIKLTALSYEMDIRVLPFKTLLVYLEMEGIIRPKHTRFDEYTFKYQVEPAVIINTFEGERRKFISEVFNNCQTKKVWTYVDLPGILQSYDQANRERIIAALEYFSEKGWIELQSKQAVESYDILKNDFNVQVVGKKLGDLFGAKERQEIERIHKLINFFESDSCISKRLAHYFGEYIDKDHCGHCSFCQSGPAYIEYTIELPPLSSYCFRELTGELSEAARDNCSVQNITKFLCGISSPSLIRLKAKKLKHFGTLERHPFLEVKSWVHLQLQK
ncbi:ATP-dependent DNA helicase RecQ [Desulfitispora alkaliphila]|uniref:RecQ family ATP-dependent DNA helicase n=1 Tax=Desulfitispora alkaliphila TaxID=622674 RepID=UPI003D204619